ncbi:hypothetical protein, partial [Heyndrickxia coagulans]|uniref:hypothetical protein n=1 Tax=Heyndrickxia coagulans TaxID=1398 RepID=UPI00214DC902
SITTSCTSNPLSISRGRARLYCDTSVTTLTDCVNCGLGLNIIGRMALLCELIMYDTTTYAAGGLCHITKGLSTLYTVDYGVGVLGNKVNGALGAGLGGTYKISSSDMS